MRPPGEIRQTLRAVFSERGASTWREVMSAIPAASAQSPSERALVRRTVENMVRSGEVLRVGQAKPAGSKRWHALYEAAPPVAYEEPAAAERGADMQPLADVMKNWMIL
jgi:hypothetical protein